MYLKKLKPLTEKHKTVNTFGGMNKSKVISENELADTENLSSRYYPALATRRKRSTVQNGSGHSPNALIFKGGLYWADGTGFYANGTQIPGIVLDASNADKRTAISFGAYIILHPDGVWYNTETGEKGTVNNRFEKSNGEYTLDNCLPDGTEIEYTSGATEPSNPADGQYFVNTAEGNTLRIYSAESELWTDAAMPCVKLCGEDIAGGFEAGDCVNISGIAGAEHLNGASEIIFVNQSLDGNGDYLVLTGAVAEDITVTPDLSEPIVIERLMPKMDFVAERNNRLWGCRYGLNNQGNVVNEIYASALGDFKNWYKYEGISTDSYAASVGSDGEFTAVATVGSTLCFFKENCVHKVYGDEPSDFRIVTTRLDGVEKGSSKSVAAVGNLLFYKSPVGIMSYGGSLAKCVSHDLGEEIFTNAKAGSLGSLYYVSMEDGSNDYSLFVYDTEKMIWHREDGTEVREFCPSGNNLYFVDSGQSIKKVISDGENEEDDFSWCMESGDLALPVDGRKYPQKISFRMSLAESANAEISIAYDNSDNWEPVRTLRGFIDQSFTVDLHTKRCDKFRIRICGRGEMCLLSRKVSVAVGSEY